MSASLPISAVPGGRSSSLKQRFVYMNERQLSGSEKARANVRFWVVVTVG